MLLLQYVKDDYSSETIPLIWEPGNKISIFLNIQNLDPMLSSPLMCKFWAKYLWAVQYSTAELMLIYLKFWNLSSAKYYMM